MPDHDSAAYEAKLQAARRELNAPPQGLANNAMEAARELTVGELLDRRIRKAESLLKALHDLKGNLPSQFLNSGASRISAFLEL